MKRFRLTISIITVMLIAVIFCGCTSNKVGTVFSTSYQINLTGSESRKTSTQIEDILNESENKFSVTIKTSDVYKINNAEKNVPIKVSSDTLELINLSKKLYLESDGFFNPAIYPLVKLWGLDPDNYSTVKSSIPSDSEIAQVLPYCTMDNFIIDYDNVTVTKLDSRSMIDFGGIAKGYAVDKSADICTSQDSYLINVGGEMRIGNQEKTIAIASPFDNTKYIDTLSISNTAIATSGVYERYFTYNNTKYNHIIDKNGQPCNTGIVSVTVIANTATICDALATCGIMMPLTDFKQLLDLYAARAIIVDADGNVTRT